MADAAAIEAHKEQKYDRQLRLWGKTGQSSVERSRILCIGSGPAATETMKNLVLPGLGHFVVLDDKIVEGADLGNNFFLTKDSLGKPRATETTQWIRELNPDCQSAEAVTKNPGQVIDNDPEFFKKFTIVIASELTEKHLLKLGEICHGLNIPLVIVEVYGFMGYLRIALPEHTIIESKPDFPHIDLRISEPFPALKTYAESINLASLNSKQHSHTPFPVLLIQSINDWKSKNGGKVPATTAEKDAFKRSIAMMQWKPDEENFKEATNNAKEAYLPYRLPADVQAVLDNPKADATNVKPDTPNFWLMAAALRQFVQSEGQGKLPLAGTIPDMTAETDTYIQLQAIYRSKSEEDFAAVRKHLDGNLSRIGKPASTISEDDFTLFCKHVAYLRAYSYHTLAQEFDPATNQKENWTWQLEDTQSSNAHIYVLWRAARRFQGQHGHYPCSDLSQPLEAELPKFKAVVQAFLQEHEVAADAVSDDWIREWCRYGSSQLHSLGAIMGGVTSQEVIKIITHQWIPLNNTYIYNALRSNSNSYDV